MPHPEPIGDDGQGPPLPPGGNDVCRNALNSGPAPTHTESGHSNIVAADDRERSVEPDRTWPDRSSGRPIRIQGFRLLEKLGEGGTSQVFLACRDDDPAPLVLKVLDRPGEHPAEAIAGYTRECALSSRILHPNVARVLFHGTSDGFPYLAMEYFSGGDLRRHIRDGLGTVRSLELLCAIAAGLEAIHRAGVVHCDLKPGNVMLRADGTVAITDFGIATRDNRGGMLADHDPVVGTPAYLSPEQSMGAAATQRSDVYSLGVILHEMLTGRKPFEHASALELLDMHVHAPVPQLPARAAICQPLLDRLLAKAPGKRLRSASDAIRQAQALLETIRNGGTLPSKGR